MSTENLSKESKETVLENDTDTECQVDDEYESIVLALTDVAVASMDMRISELKKQMTNRLDKVVEKLEHSTKGRS